MIRKITKSETKHLAELARIKLTEEELEKFEGDLGKILNYFEELKELQTSGIEPKTGGTGLVNISRDDEQERTSDTMKGKEQFPEEDGGYLKTPSVF